MLKKCNINIVNINGEHIVRSDKVKYLGGLLDSTLFFCQYITYNKMSSSQHQLTKNKAYQKVPHQRHLSAINTIICHVAL